MPTNKLLQRFEEIEKLAIAAGLDFYPVHFFEVPSQIIWQTAAYGLPTRYSHWSFGKNFTYQQAQSEMGASKIYELIINNANPAIAYLDNTNTDTVNLLIAAHCMAHSCFFKNNIMFRIANETDMVAVANRHAVIIDQFREEYGDDVVDNWIDVALSLERHIDSYKGIKRTKYPSRHIEYEEHPVNEWDDVVNLTKQTEPRFTKVTKGLHIPPKPEKDILWFLSEYASLDDWQKKIFEIVRRESYYFYPQFCTKTLNEGFASFFHNEIMNQYALGNENDYGIKDIVCPLTNEEHLDFMAYHEKVVQPGIKIPLKIEVYDKKSGKYIKVFNPKVSQNPGLFNAATRVNPYYIGFKMLRYIKQKWDTYYQQGYMENEYGDKIPVTITGNQKVIEVMKEEDDLSFLRKYLNDELINELHLFSFGTDLSHYDDNYEIQEKITKRFKDNPSTDLGKMSIDDQVIQNNTIIVNSKQKDEIIKCFAREKHNYGVPYIVVRRVDESGLLRLEHKTEDRINIDLSYAEHVLKYIYKAWKRPIELIRKCSNKTWVLTYDGIMFNVDYQGIDYPDNIEKSDAPSSW